MTRPDFIRSQLSEAEVDDLRDRLTAAEAQSQQMLVRWRKRSAS